MHREIPDNIENIFNVEEVNLKAIDRFPVKLLYQRKGANFCNIIVIEDRETLINYIDMRKYLIDNLGENEHKMSTIRLYE
ncbi:MAG: hypothetical protein JEZ08_16405 [Clostridiales bacterium]|nr:hypothetical protein [Clostridiales bacterium]